MRHPLRTLAAVAFAAAGLLAVPAEAQYGGYGSAGPGFDSGYRDGFTRGQDDARASRRFDYGRDGDYRRGDRGYDRRYGDRESYRRDYRSGFVAGYNDGFYGRRGTGQYGRERAIPRGRQGAGYPSPYPTDRRYPDSRNPYGSGYAYGPGYDAGYSDGYEQGLEDGDDRDRFDPTRHRRYRSADRGYSSRYGPREQYKNAYREGFRRGYDAGYRDGQRYGERDQRRTSRLPWPF